ncbi:MAG: GNAT family N-acetyltransferase [Lachnospiraceae bacterium]|nr:GNAT family N-acetyltransferase [Lachnospiraceae bacterium]
MIIKNGCVTLRAVEETDFDLLFCLINEPRIENMTVGFHLPVSSAEQKKWMQNYSNSMTDIRLMIELDNGNTIGMVMLNDIDYKNGSASIGYKISASSHDRIRGDMQDAIAGMLNYAFNELRLNCVISAVLDYNVFSLKLMKKMHFTQEGILRKRIYKNGEFHDLIAFSILRSEFEEHKNI